MPEYPRYSPKFQAESKGRRGAVGEEMLLYSPRVESSTTLTIEVAPIPSTPIRHYPGVEGWRDANLDELADKVGVLVDLPDPQDLENFLLTAIVRYTAVPGDRVAPELRQMLRRLKEKAR